MAYDLIVRATDPNVDTPLTVLIEDGKVVDVARDIQVSARQEINATDCTILPGWIDAHVHFNEPGRTDWEGIETGSWALAKGGGTCFFDMPLNSSPPVLNRHAFEQKREIAKQKSCIDFALWGGLTPDSLDHLEDMADAGAIGFKAFLCNSGLDEFQAADVHALKTGMHTAAALKLPVATHAEFDPPGSNPSKKDMRAWLDSRPIQLELDAIEMATEMAGETGCALHIVHVSCAEGIDLITQAKANGVDVTVETCPHYLLLDEDDAIEIGASAKCAPPLRNSKTVEHLWQKLRNREIDTIGSDHSPSSPELKQGDDLFAVWGGIAGIQHGLPLLLDCSEKMSDLKETVIPLNFLLFDNLISHQVAKRFRLANKGGFTIGNDADFSLISKAQPHTICAEDLVTQHPNSPYCGRKMRHQVQATYQRGKRVTPESRGQFLRPTI